MRPKTRIRDQDLDAIIEAFRKNFGPQDQLWLFGSRLDLERRGGDIDLYIETNLSLDEAYKKRTRFVVDMWNKIGEQKIDVMLNVVSGSENEELPMYTKIKIKGVQLV